MKVYPESTYLHGSDRHVLDKYRSEFYDFSPEFMTGRIVLNNEKILNDGKPADSRLVQHIMTRK